jgi:LuxR family transcriptional regulator, maltose regulon positive regulatory protein
MMTLYQPKIVPPRLREVVPRERLFKLLDNLKDYPVTWISSPAGTGKTTLAASYAHSRGMPILWYRIDETDNDVAGFFYHMREAAKTLKKGRTKPLPFFSPEYRFGLPAFTRNYFASLFSRMNLPGIVVLDNYQDVPDDSAIHEVMRNGLGEVPVGIRVLIASRKEPPSPLVSLKAESILTEVGWNDMRFTLDEIRKIVQQRKNGPVPDDVVKRIYDETQGWAAALVLMLAGKGTPSVGVDSIGQSDVFDYFTVEIFHRLDQRLQDFLMISAILPGVSLETASLLTGMKESEAMIAYLSRNQYFIERYGKEYRFHPLFHKFLLTQAKSRYAPEEYSSFVMKAGEILARIGQTEEAILLLLNNGAYPDTLPLILGHAQSLLGSGRTATLEQWVARLPAAMVDTVPWLSYWLGMGRIVTDPAGARKHLEKAFHGFEPQGDQMGRLLAAAGAMNSIIFQWDAYQPLDPWIDWMDENVDAHTPLPSPDLEAHVCSAMVCALTWRKPWHRNMAAWVNRAAVVSRQVEDTLVRCLLKSNVMEYHGLMGNWTEMRLIAEEFRQMIDTSSEVSPLANLVYMVRMLELHDWVTGSWADTYRRLQKALHLSEEMGAYSHLPSIYLHGMILAYETKNLELAEEFLKKMGGAVVSGKRVMMAFYHNMNSFRHLQKGNLVAAHEDALVSVTSAVEAGVYVAEAYARVTLAYVLRCMAKTGAARDQLKRAESIHKDLGVTHTLYLIRLTEASLHFDEGNHGDGRKALGEALRIGKEKGYAMTLYWYWQPDEMARLCAEALASSVESEYARELIRCHSLVPGGSLDKLHGWPWPCRITTFGRFELIENDKLLAFTGKVQKKPLALLKALISLGGKEVREEEIEDLLWPDAEGDAAHIALKTTLSRLRKLLENEAAIEVREGKISLNERIVWLDAWVLESLVRQISALPRGHRQTSVTVAEELAAVALNVYRGEFLKSDDEWWISQHRDRFRAIFLRIVKGLGEMLSSAGETDRSRYLYEGATDRGFSPQELYGSGALSGLNIRP